MPESWHFTNEEEEKKWILQTIPRCFQDVGFRGQTEGDLIFGLYRYGWIHSEDDLDGYLLRLFEEESEKGNYIVYWEDEEQPRRFFLLR